MSTTLSVTTSILLIVFALTTCWLSNAEQVALKSESYSKAPNTKYGVIIMPEGKLNTRETTTTMERVNSTHLNNVCNLCEDVTNEMLELLRSKKTQKRIMDILHGSCSLFFNLKQKCMAIVNSYGLAFFEIVQIVQPKVICHSIHLCSSKPSNSTTYFMSEDRCEVCRYVVGKALTELKYPNKQLEIINESVLKTCITMEGNEEKCKILVFEYARMIMDNTKHFLEAMDLCAATRTCDSSSSSIMTNR